MSPGMASSVMSITGAGCREQPATPRMSSAAMARSAMARRSFNIGRAEIADIAAPPIHRGHESRLRRSSCPPIHRGHESRLRRSSCPLHYNATTRRVFRLKNAPLALWIWIELERLLVARIELQVGDLLGLVVLGGIGGRHVL